MRAALQAHYGLCITMVRPLAFSLPAQSATTGPSTKLSNRIGLLGLLNDKVCCNFQGASHGC